MSIPKRYFAEMSQSFNASLVTASSGHFTNYFVSDDITASFHAEILCKRIVPEGGPFNEFVLTPSGSGRAKVVKVQVHPNPAANTFYFSYSVRSIGVPGGNWFGNTGGVCTGTVLAPSGFLTASLSSNPALTVIGPGSLCVLSSTAKLADASDASHTGSLVYEVFYRTEVI